jgi:hypothetical protein
MNANAGSIVDEEKPEDQPPTMVEIGAGVIGSAVEGAAGGPLCTLMGAATGLAAGLGAAGAARHRHPKEHERSNLNPEDFPSGDDEDREGFQGPDKRG